ncbi:MAG: NAD(P)H-dependent oxidoreductase [Micavibrio sp.]|nr:NAD(P)H-dependent oxidoreductase [Micavibrio sp.]
MKIAIISGSHRGESQSTKISKWLGANLEARGQGIEADILDLAHADIPFWDEGAWNVDSDLSTFMRPFLARMAAADAFILVAPEWGGMAPAMLKNFLLYLGTAQCGHKPAMIVGVSSGRGGKYPMTELRISGYKNTRLCFIPDHLIVQDCEKVMNEPALDSGSENDQHIKRRADHTLGVLVAYAKAFNSMREEHGSKLLDKEFPFGQ